MPKAFVLVGHNLREVVRVGSCILCDVYKITGVQILFKLRALRRQETDALQY